MRTYIICFLLLVNYSAFSQCAVDVTINEGATIEMCSNALLPITASNGFVAYSWAGPVTGITQSITPNATGQYTVSAVDGVGCVSTATIDVTVHALPVDAIISSAGDTLCGSITSSTLSLSGTYQLYDWGGGISTPTHTVTSPGTYSVNVADNNFCVSTFTFQFVEVNFSVDTTYGDNCSGGNVVIQATGGSSYAWSTGETGSTIVVVPTETTDYTVVITEGSCTQTITTTVVPIQNFIDYTLQDTFYVAANEQLILVGPDNFSTYEWSPGDQLIDSTGMLANFSGTESQLITLTAVHPDGCTGVWSTMVIVVDLMVPNGFSPNGDGINDFFVITELDTIPGALVVWNRWGDIVYQSENYENDWRGTCESGTCLGSGGDLPEGTYFYQVDAKGITKKGYVTLKRK